MKVKKPKTRGRHGGARPNSGRPYKKDKGQWGQITCVLRKDTIDKLQTEGSKRFGDYLQYHLDRHPLPSKEEYEALLKRQPLITVIKGRRTPVIIAGGLGPSMRRAKPVRRTQKEMEEALTKALS